MSITNETIEEDINGYPSTVQAKCLNGVYRLLKGQNVPRKAKLMIHT